MTTLREQLREVAGRWVSPHFANRMMEGDPMRVVEILASIAWLEQRPEDSDTRVLRAVHGYISEHKTLPLDTPGIT